METNADQRFHINLENIAIIKQVQNLKYLGILSKKGIHSEYIINDI